MPRWKRKPLPMRREKMLQAFGRSITEQNAHALGVMRTAAANMRRFIRQRWSERELNEFMAREREN